MKSKFCRFVGTDKPTETVGCRLSVHVSEASNNEVKNCRFVGGTDRVCRL